MKKPNAAAVRWMACGGLCLGLAGEYAPAQEPSSAPLDKSRYTLLNPTPPEAMREMSTDRPDTTESPHTVDAGHFQVELSLVDYAYNDDAGTETRTLGVLPTNVKVGLLNDVDIQFVFTPYERVTSKADGAKETADGFSDDTQIRLKINLWGNDPSADPTPDPWNGTAFAIMPYIKFPTGSDELSNDHVEGGLIFPLAISLPREWNLVLMAQTDFVYNEASDGYGVDFVHTATVGHDVPGIERLGFYIEYIGIAPHQTGSTYQAIGSGGFTYQANPNWSLDCGGSVGISDSADDFRVFAGTSFRI